MSTSIAAQMSRHLGYAGRIEENLDRAVTVRPSSTALFGVDSFDRYATPTDSQFGLTSPYSFQITKNQNIFNGFFNRIALTELVFPYYIPNINPRTNTVSVIYNGGASATLTLTSGFYTPTALATALQNALIPLTNFGTTVTYNALGRFVIDVGGGNDLILFPTGTDAFGLFDLIGGTADWINPGAQVLTGKVTRCRYTEYIDIVSSQLTYNQDLKDATTTNGYSRDVLARVYLETENDQPIPVLVGATSTTTLNTIPGTYPFTIYRQFKTPKQIHWDSTQPIGNLVFEVYDDRGVLLSGNGTGANGDFIYPDWRMTLLISEN
jgi:hypothetical protein